MRARACKGLRGHAKCCEGVRGYARVCEGVRKFARGCEGVRKFVRACEGLQGRLGAYFTLTLSFLRKRHIFSELRSIFVCVSSDLNFLSFLGGSLLKPSFHLMNFPFGVKALMFQ